MIDTVCEQRTVQGGTMTSEGMVSHKLHPDGFYMPVKLDIKRGYKQQCEFYPPLRDMKGRYIYAMPGGASVVVLPM